jgi:hypothetical protein
MLEEVRENVQSSLALELRKMKERARITIVGNSRRDIQRDRA